MVTPEFIEASDPEELPPCGPGESTTSPDDCELYFRGYLEVPKCCNGDGCQKCQGAGGFIDSGPVDHHHAYPTPVPEEMVPDGVPTQAETFDHAARRPVSNRRTSGQVKQTSMPVPTSVSSNANSRPSLIGPVGYDTLK